VASRSKGKISNRTDAPDILLEEIHWALAARD